MGKRISEVGWIDFDFFMYFRIGFGGAWLVFYVVDFSIGTVVEKRPLFMNFNHL